MDASRTSQFFMVWMRTILVYMHLYSVKNCKSRLFFLRVPGLMTFQRHGGVEKFLKFQV